MCIVSGEKAKEIKKMLKIEPSEETEKSKQVLEEMFSGEEIPKYKKKSKRKGQPRSKHKHQYKTVLLHSINHYDWSSKPIEYLTPTKVCQICGRISDRDNDESLYIKEKLSIPGLKDVCKTKLSTKALKLPKWHREDWNKFAVPMSKEVSEVFIHKEVTLDDKLYKIIKD